MVVGRPSHTRGATEEKRCEEVFVLEQGMSMSADFAMAYIVVAAMTNMLANPVCSSCNIIMIVCL